MLHELCSVQGGYAQHCPLKGQAPRGSITTCVSMVITEEEGNRVNHELALKISDWN